jgi:hypothetical protein
VAPADTERHGAIISLIKHARRGLLNPETEIGKDEWDSAARAGTASVPPGYSSPQQ